MTVVPKNHCALLFVVFHIPTVGMNAWPSVNDERYASDALANSVGSLGMRALFVIFGPLLGFFIDKYGTNEAMKLMGFIYVAGLFLVAMPLLSQRHHFKVG